MTYKELVKAVSWKCDVSYREARKFISAITDTVSDAVSNGGGVRIAGFGTFTVKNRKERNSYNPAMGTTVIVPATKVPKFTPAKAFRDKVK